MTDPIRSQFAANFKQACEDAGMTITDIARAHGCARTSMSRLANGQREPKLTTIVQLARILRVTPADLMRDIH